MVNPNYDLQYQGKIVNLNSFNGPVSITSSTFEYNTLGYNGGCAIFNQGYGFTYYYYDDLYPIFSH